jgi:formylglycine-generating enzyme required for sulfatase activity
MRGGAWYDFPWYCRSASRGYADPGLTFSVVGFRVVLDTGK